MGKKGGVLPIAIVAVIVISFTLAVFFLLDIERAALNLWALAFLLLSEAILFGGLIAVRLSGAGHSVVFMKSGVTATLLLYFVVTLISMFFTRIFTDNVNAFILMELAIFALFAIITVSILAFSRSLRRRESEDAAKVGSTEARRGGF